MDREPRQDQDQEQGRGRDGGGSDASPLESSPRPLKAFTSDARRPLTANEERAALMFVSGEAPDAIARSCGVQRDTVLAWFRRPAFHQAVELYREPQREAARAVLEGAALDAAQCLRDAAIAGDVKAAIAILKGVGVIRDERQDAKGADEILAQERAARYAARHSELRGVDLPDDQAPPLIETAPEPPHDG